MSEEMTQAQIDRIADVVAERVAHLNCPVGITDEGAKAINALGRSIKEIGATDSDMTLALRVAHEANNLAVRFVRWGIAVVAILIVATLLALFTDWRPWK